MVNDKQVERRNLRMTVTRRHHRACTWSISLRPKVNFVLNQWRLGGARSGSMHAHGTPMGSSVPVKCANALRVGLIDDFSARYLSVQKDHDLQKISARSNFSSMESRPWRAHMFARYGQSRCCRFHLPWVPGTL